MLASRGRSRTGGPPKVPAEGAGRTEKGGAGAGMPVSG